MSKNIILHIGTQKTGTTAIQIFLTNNQTQLKDEGFEYLDPRTGKLGLDNHNHGHLALCLTGYWRNTNHQLTREEAWGMLKSAVEESEHTVIVSSELLSTPQILPHLPFIKASLGGLNVKVIIYLRRQDIFVQSVYKERLKGNEQRIFETAYQEGDYKKVLDFRNIVDQWAHSFGQENIQIRPYEKKQLLNGDILADFMNVIGSGIGDEMQRLEEHINKRMNRHILEISRELNLLDLKGPVIRDLKWWLHNIIEAGSNDPFLDHSIISPAQRLEIINSFIDGNRYIAKKYLNRPDGTLFYDQLPYPTDHWEEYCGMPAVYSAKILAEIFKRSNLLESFGDVVKRVDND